jgi:predicted dehydrogenase
MKALVIGFGAIGRRHADNLAALGHEVALLRHAPDGQPNGRFREYFELDEAVETEEADFAVIASPTPNHADDARRLLDRDLPFLLEKPPTGDLPGMQELHRQIALQGFERYDIAFNLRYYPPLLAIREHLPRIGRVASLRAAAGYFLPAWRPAVDYRKTTSASRALGGGVHIELVHELDYIIWFLGLPSRVLAHIATVGDLEIDSADLCAAVMQYDAGPVVELHLDYLAHKNVRGCQVTGTDGTIEWSFVDGAVTLYRAGEAAEELFRLPRDYDFNETYLAELRHFARVAEGAAAPSVDTAQGLRVMQLLDGMIAANSAQQWQAL